MSYHNPIQPGRPMSVEYQMPPCTCYSRDLSTQHFEDCPRFQAQGDLNRLTLIPEKEPRANLGLASTEELLRELSARGRVESVNAYPTAGRQLSEDCERLLRELPPEMRALPNERWREGKRELRSGH